MGFNSGFKGLNQEYTDSGIQVAVAINFVRWRINFKVLNTDIASCNIYVAWNLEVASRFYCAPLI